MHNLKVGFKVAKIFSEENCTPIVGVDMIKSPSTAADRATIGGDFIIKENINTKPVNHSSVVIVKR